jgi:hypothetical protein
MDTNAKQFMRIGSKYNRITLLGYIDLFTYGFEKTSLNILRLKVYIHLAWIKGFYDDAE